MRRRGQLLEDKVEKGKLVSVHRRWRVTKGREMSARCYKGGFGISDSLSEMFTLHTERIPDNPPRDLHQGEDIASQGHRRNRSKIEDPSESQKEVVDNGDVVDPRRLLEEAELRAKEGVLGVLAEERPIHVDVCE